MQIVVSREKRYRRASKHIINSKKYKNIAPVYTGTQDTALHFSLCVLLYKLNVL